MGAGCSTRAASSEPQNDIVPSRPAYLAGDLVGPPVIEKVNIGPIDMLVGQAAQFAEALCSLSDSLSGILLDVRLATGLLQGGFALELTRSPNVDIFSVELLSAQFHPLDVTEAARLRGRDLTGQGRLAALDAHLAQCVEELAEYFIRRADDKEAVLSLSSSGTLMPKASGQTIDPVVQAFNRAMLDMRSALGEDYLLALHLHKAQARGTAAFRVRLLKPASSPSSPATTAGHGAAAPAAAGDAPTGGASSAAGAAPSVGGTMAAWQLATLLDQTACLNASHLHDALHMFYDANGRLAAAVKEAGLAHPEALMLTSPRSVALAGTSAAPAAPSSLSSKATRRQHQHAGRPSTDSTSSRGMGGARGPGGSRAPPATGAAALRALSATSRAVVARAVEAFNAAAHLLGHAAAAAPGPASFAALLTHVLGELRDLVAQAGGDPALEAFRPTVHFSLGPNQSIVFHLNPHLDELRASGWGHSILPFPDCLSVPVRRAWLLLQELLQLHNSAVTELESLGQLVAAFDDGIRCRVGTVAADAEASRLSLAEAAVSAKALLRNHGEIRACSRGAIHTLSETARLVREEMAEAAQLANVQCSVMSPLAWSISIASSSLGGTASITGASMTSPTSSTAASSCAVSPLAPGTSLASQSSGAAPAMSPFQSPVRQSTRSGLNLEPRAAAWSPGTALGASPQSTEQPRAASLPEPLPLPRMPSRNAVPASADQLANTVRMSDGSVTAAAAAAPNRALGASRNAQRVSTRQYDKDRALRSMEPTAGWVSVNGRGSGGSVTSSGAGGSAAGGERRVQVQLQPSGQAETGVRARARAEIEAGALTQAGAEAGAGLHWQWRSGQSLRTCPGATGSGESLAEEYARTALAHLRF